MVTKVVVHHFHEGNDADKSIRKHAVYATVARIVNLDTGEYETPGVWALCGKRDVPSRSQGRAIAIGRLQKLYPDSCKDADFGVFKGLKNK